MKKYLIALSLAIAASSTFASTPKPDVCPSVAALQNVKFDQAVPEHGGWAAIQTKADNFETKDQWLFAMMVGDVNSGEEAINKASLNLNALVYNSGPVKVFVDYACYYFSEEAMGIAMTPGDTQSLMKTLLK